jgi:FtsP/CotA-like multicopper oxidase with cupredoxin domain
MQEIRRRVAAIVAGPLALLLITLGVLRYARRGPWWSPATPEAPQGKTSIRGTSLQSVAKVVDDSSNCDAPDYTMTFKMRKQYVWHKGQMKGPYSVRTVCDARGCEIWNGTLQSPNTLFLTAGQNYTFLFKNEIDPDHGLGPRPQMKSDYTFIMNGSKFPNCTGMKKRFRGKLPSSSSEYNFAMELPQPHQFDTANVHFHGLSIMPHLFHPTGTTDLNAAMEHIKPGESWCFRFHMPDWHPSGSYFYHMHNHGVTWYHSEQLTAGAVQVKGRDADEVWNLGIHRDEWFVIKDWHECAWLNHPQEHCLHDHTLDAGLLINGVIMPTLLLQVGETVRLRIMRIGDMPMGFRIVDKHNVSVPFWNIGSDGYLFKQGIEKQVLVFNFGMREDILLQIPHEGSYTVVSDLDKDKWCFFGCECHVQRIEYAKIEVRGTAGSSPIDLAGVRITPQHPPVILDADIVQRREISLSFLVDRNHVPAPLFYMNDELYNETQTAFVSKAGTSEEWVINNPDDLTHIIHVHVNPFTVKEVATAHSTQGLEKFNAFLDQIRLPEDKWRDTVAIPPKGFVRLWVHFFEQHRGKAVVHCHYLGHEDNGMMMNFVIA